jgi:hypothetical protein
MVEKLDLCSCHGAEERLGEAHWYGKFDTIM